jgi:hypothetical protein
MSDQPGAAGGGEPSEEEVRAYVEQLRSAPADQVVAEVASALLNAAQVKLGRKDGRLLIDVATSVADGVRGRLDKQLTDQLDQALTQLRLAQVDAEQQVAQAAARGHEEPGDLPAQAPPTKGDGDAQPGATPPSEPGPSSSAASRLWVPGR